MKKLLSLLLATALISAGFVSAKKLVIHLNNGTTFSRSVSDVDKITFEEDSDVPGQGGNTGDDLIPDEYFETGQLVDLGLSVKWAGWNVGAEKAEEYGDFFAYGEVTPKSDYTFNNYKWSVDDFVDDDMGEWAQYLKLGSSITGTNYDAAHVNWGDKWRMPSTLEWEELYQNCDKVWTSVNGVTGAKFTSKINGKAIFIPAAGNKYNGKHDHEGLNCMYWSPEEPDEFNPNDFNMECRNYRIDISATYSNSDGYDYPYIGFTIRPVYGDPEPERLPNITKIPTADEAVDLGLPSGTLWAPYNLGATSESGAGLYLCYGELTEKPYTHTYNYKYFDPLTGTCFLFENNDIQGTEYDAANVLWGDGWVIPNKEQMEELLRECTWTPNGTYGYRVTGKNGNSIYLPCLDSMSYIGIQYSYPRELKLLGSTGTENTKNDMFYGIVASNGDTFMTQTAPYLRTWCAKESGTQVRPVRVKK